MVGSGAKEVADECVKGERYATDRESRVRDVHVTNKHRNFCAQRSKRRQGSLRRLAVGKLQKCVATHRAQRICNTACMLEKRTNDTHSHNLRNAFAAIFSKKKRTRETSKFQKKKSMPRCHEVSAAFVVPSVSHSEWSNGAHRRTRF